MFRSVTIIRELAIEPGESYIDMKTFSKVMSLIVMRWCGSITQYGLRIVCCAERDSSLLQQLCFYSPQWLYMFRATISPIIRSTYAVYGHR